MAADPLFGWDLTFKTVEKDVKRKSDILIAFIHWNLTKRGFRSIGIGDEVSNFLVRIQHFLTALFESLKKNFHLFSSAHCQGMKKRVSCCQQDGMIKRTIH